MQYADAPVASPAFEQSLAPSHETPSSIGSGSGSGSGSKQLQLAELIAEKRMLVVHNTMLGVARAWSRFFVIQAEYQSKCADAEESDNNDTAMKHASTSASKNGEDARKRIRLPTSASEWEMLIDGAALDQCIVPNVFLIPPQSSFSW